MRIGTMFSITSELYFYRFDLTSLSTDGWICIHHNTQPFMDSQSLDSSITYFNH